jgi:hypothetical protein
MKRLFIISSLMVLFTFNALAQIPIWSVDAAKYVGKTVSFDEYVYDVTYNPGANYFLIHLADPDVKKSPIITVVIHKVNNKKRIVWLQSLNGQTISVTGKLLSNNGKFIINGDSPGTLISAEEAHPLIDPPPLPPTPVGKNIDMKDAALHVGELINLCDTVHVYPVLTDSLTLFCMGGRYPHQLLTVAVKNRSDIFNADNYMGDPMCVTGTIILRNNKPVLLISGPAAMLFFNYPKQQ